MKTRKVKCAGPREAETLADNARPGTILEIWIKDSKGTYRLAQRVTHEKDLTPRQR